MSTSHELDIGRLCSHCGQDSLATLFEDIFGYQSTAAHCHECGYRLMVDIGDGGGADATAKANKRDGMIVTGLDGGGEDSIAMQFGSLVGARITNDRCSCKGDPRYWCVFVNDAGVTTLHGAPADDPAFADIILDVRTRLSKVEIVPDEQLQDIPEPVAL